MHQHSFIVLAAAGLAASGAIAQPAPSDADALRAELDALRARVEQLESEDASASPAADRIALSGDLRYRHETINDDALPNRSRHRIRARFKLGADLGDDLEVGLTIATGADNPVSANQTIGDGFSRKDIGFDRAFFAWDMSDELTLTGGKIANPWFRAGDQPLLFDGDLNPEGIALGYDGDRVFATVAGFWVDERAAQDDAFLYALQGGYRMDLADGGAQLTVGGGFLNYKGVQGFVAPYFIVPRGNSIDTAGGLLYDFDIVELFAEAELEAGGQPLRLFVDYVENTEADSLDTGLSFGARWRRASAPGSWEVAWAWQDLEADAVLASFTDSDFAGGGTDGKGHVIRGAYMLRSNVRFNGTYFLNERGAAAGNERDYHRLQLDVSFLF